VLCVASIVGVALTQKLPGLRRATGFVSGFSVIVACAWAAPWPQSGARRLVVAATQLACLLLVVHHLTVYTANYRYLVGETSRVNDAWLSGLGSPDASIRTWAKEWFAKGKRLDCGRASPCRYTEIFSAVAGYLRGKGQCDLPVMAIEPESGRVIQLTVR